MTRQEICDALDQDDTFKSLRGTLKLPSTRDIIIDYFSVKDLANFSSVDAAVVYINYMFLCQYCVNKVTEKLASKKELKLQDYTFEFTEVEAENELDLVEDGETAFYFTAKADGKVEDLLRVALRTITNADPIFEQEAKKDKVQYFSLPVDLIVYVDYKGDPNIWWNETNRNRWARSYKNRTTGLRMSNPHIARFNTRIYFNKEITLSQFTANTLLEVFKDYIEAQD